MQPRYGLSGAQFTNNRHHPEYNSLPNRSERRRDSRSSTGSAPDPYGDFRKYGMNSGVRRELLDRAVFDDSRWVQYVEVSKLQDVGRASVRRVDGAVTELTLVVGWMRNPRRPYKRWRH